MAKQEEILKNGMMQAYTLGKIESLEMIAEMVETGLISNMDNLKSMTRAIRKTCAEEKKKLNIEVSDRSSNEITDADLERAINAIKNI